MYQNRQTVVKVGDTSVDVLEGQFAGCGLVVAVTTGAYTREQLVEYQPDHIIDSMQVNAALNKNNIENRTGHKICRISAQMKL